MSTTVAQQVELTCSKSESPTPGGRGAMRRLRLVFLLDASGSMAGEKLESLNNAVEELIPILRKEANANSIDMQLRILKFETSAIWVDDTWRSIHDYQFTPLEVGGTTAMGEALGRLFQEFQQLEVANDYPPVLINVTDGCATDEDEYKANLIALQTLPYFANAVRVPISIGDNPREDLLRMWASPHAEQIFTAHNAEQLVHLIRYTTIASVRQVSQPAHVAPEAILAPPPVLAECQNDELIF